jgi:hypothetical protein
MRTLFLKATSYKALQEHLLAHDCHLTGQNLQCDGFIVDWIGKIPKTLDEEGIPTEWFTYQRFNVLLIDENVTIFDSFDQFNPEEPYRVFS